MKKPSVMLEDELLIPRSDAVPHGGQKQSLVNSFILAAAILLALPRVVKADVSLTAQETLMQAQDNAVMGLDYTFGPDTSTVLQYNYTVDTNGGSFSYSTLPGQIYGGQNYSESVSGTYDPST